jgi:hypothetical protein
MKKYFMLTVCLFVSILMQIYADDESALSSFSDPSRIWGNGVESVIEEAYRQCFKTYIIGERVMNLRMPFAQNYERSELVNHSWEFIGGGKANPVYLWSIISELLESEDFKSYTETLQDSREKVAIFDIPSQTWTTSRDLFDVARLKAGSYRGLPHRPYILNSGSEIRDTDVYNYLYCIGWVGMDCSGFVWHVLNFTAKAGGLDLGQRLRTVIGVPRGADPAYYAGTWFFNSDSREIIAVDDKLSNLQPADVLLFRGEDGSMVHSAIIQSIDLKEGVIRYLQCTDEAPLEQRGAHESHIYFDPSNPNLRLTDTELTWQQERYAPFPGEKESPFSDDGKRYRAYSELGGGRVIRLRTMAEPIARINRDR